MSNSIAPPLEKRLELRCVYRNGSSSIWAEVYEGQQGPEVVLSRYRKNKRSNLGAMTLDESIAVGDALSKFVARRKSTIERKVCFPTKRRTDIRLGSHVTYSATWMAATGGDYGRRRHGVVVEVQQDYAYVRWEDKTAERDKVRLRNLVVLAAPSKD